MACRASLKLACLLFAVAFPLTAAWLEDVSPLLTTQERKLYLSLKDPARTQFETHFWQTRRITPAEYYQRRAFAQANYGLRSDRGRMYLALGAPQKISRLPSTRSFWPLEIWYYDETPDVGIPRQCYFTFFQRNGIGDYVIYSPQLDTIRALLNPQAGTRGIFPVNDIISQADITNALNLSPAEQEIADAAVAVSKGITGSGNEEIIGIALAPETTLNKAVKTQVSSRFIAGIERPKLNVFQTWTADGVPTLDLELQTPLRTTIGLSVSTEESETTVPSVDGRKITYRHRLYLLPGNYTVTFRVDGVNYPFPLAVAAKRETTPLLLGSSAESKPHTPFEFADLNFSPGEGTLALVQLAQAGIAKWRLRRNGETVWSAETPSLAGGLAIAQLSAPAGKYTLEMRSGEEIRLREIELGRPESQFPVISYNANLAPGEVARSIGRQWLARGKLVEARTWLERARATRPSDAVTIDLCRVAALAGDLDAPRAALNAILAREPDNFEALTVYGFIEAKLQDYKVAAEYYRRALAIKQSPAISAALAELAKLQVR